jgi:hypothetical protein
MSEQERKRWREGAAPIAGLSEAMVAYSEKGASDAELARLHAALASQLARPTTSATGAVRGWSSIARIGTWVSVAVIGAASIWNVNGRDAAEPRSGAETRALAPAVVLHEAPAQAVVASPEPSPEPSPVAAPAEPVVAPRPRVQAKPTAAVIATAEPQAPAPTLSVEAELELLREAQSALNRSASTALALAEEHAQLYPHGAFVEEREMLRIEAELTLGQRSTALARAKAFSERFGRSTYRARIERLLAAHDALKDKETSADDRTQ